jgi:RNA polymerase sigma factor (sigma-70 family)
MTREDLPIEERVQQAKAGDQGALKAVICQIQDRVYNLALRMLQLPAAADDATQEILIRIVTHLSTFRQECAFSTWVYRIASNYLLTTRKRRAEQQRLTFQRLGEYIDESLAMGEAAIPDGYDQRLLAKEVERSCTLGMLTCLDRVSRLAFILGEIFQGTSDEGAAIMEITPAAFRQRLSRARAHIRAFVQQRCGIFNPAHPCRGSKHIGNKIRLGLLTPDQLQYIQVSEATQVEAALSEHVQTVREMDRIAALFRAHPAYRAPDRLVEGIRHVLATSRFRAFRS